MQVVSLNLIIFLSAWFLFNPWSCIQGDISSNCTHVPKPIAPEKCCQFPRLFTNAAIEYCSPKVNSTQDCFYECIYAATEICRKRECDVRKSDDYVDFVDLTETAFIPVYKRAYRECISEVTNVNTSHFESLPCDPKPELIEICVHNKMFTLCPTKYYNFKTTDCTETRTYLQNCVNA